MAVALFYNLADLTALQSALQITAAVLSGADKTACNRMLTAIGTPANAPVAPAEYLTGDLPGESTRIIVLNYAGATKQQFLDFIIKWFDQNPGARGWLRAIWKDCRTSAIDPWTG